MKFLSSKHLKDNLFHCIVCNRCLCHPILVLIVQLLLKDRPVVNTFLHFECNSSLSAKFNQFSGKLLFLTANIEDLWYQSYEVFIRNVSKFVLNLQSHHSIVTVEEIMVFKVFRRIIMRTKVRSGVRDHCFHFMQREVSVRPKNTAIEVSFYIIVVELIH